MANGLLNRRHVLFGMAAGCFASGERLLGGPVAGAAADDIALDKVPAKVKDAANKAVPRAKWAKASKSVDGGKVTYELEGEDASEREVYVEVAEDGKVNEVSFEIELEKVPKLVKDALKKKYPRFTVETAYEARHEGKVIRYDFSGRRPVDKTDITISVSTDGKTIELDEG